jgi:hypothetical protein
MKFAATITALSAFVASAAAQGIQIAQPVSILPLLYPLAVEYAFKKTPVGLSSKWARVVGVEGD